MNGKDELIKNIDVPSGYEIQDFVELDGFSGCILKAIRKAGDPEDDDTTAYVAGIFSADTKDLEGEIIDQDAVASGLKDYFSLLNCVVDWEHLYGEKKDPEFIIGECVKWEPRSIVKNGMRHRAHWGLFKIFKKKVWGKKVLDHLDAGGKIGASIQGARLKPIENGMTKKLAIIRISLTPNPINTDTSIKKYDELVKSLSASSGAAMGTQDLEGASEDKHGVRSMAERYLGHGLTAQKAKRFLSTYFNDQIKKGDLTMNDIQKAIDAAEAKLKASSDAGDGTGAPVKKSLSERTQEGIAKALEFLGVKDKDIIAKAASKGAKAVDEDNDDDDDGDTDDFEKACHYMKGMDRRELVEMAYHAKAGNVTGKSKDDIVGVVSKKLGTKGTIDTVKNYRKAIAESDLDVLKSLEAGGEVPAGKTDEEILKALRDDDGDPDAPGETVIEVGDVKDLNTLAKAVSANIALNKTLAEELVTVKKALVTVLETQTALLGMATENGKFTDALAKAVRIPGIDRAALAATPAPGAGKGAQGAPAVAMGEKHDYRETNTAIIKAIESGRRIPPETQALAKSWASQGREFTKDLEKTIFGEKTN